MEGTQRGGAVERARGGGGGGEEDQLGCHSCVEVLGTLGFQQCSAGGGDALAKQPMCCYITIGPEMTVCSPAGAFNFTKLCTEHIKLSKQRRRTAS